MEFRYLMDRIYDLEQLLPLLPAELLREDLSRLVRTVLECVAQMPGMEHLEAALPAASRPDVDALRAVADTLGKLSLRNPHLRVADRSLDPPTLLNSYHSFVEGLNGELRTLRPAELLSGLSSTSAALGDLLLCAAAAKADLTPVVDLTRKKLELVDDAQLMELWNRIKTEASGESDTNKATAKLLPKSRSKAATTADIRKRIAEYLVTVRPRLRLAACKAGRQLVPDLDATDLAALLALSRPTGPAPVSHVVGDIATAVSRLRIYWESVLAQPASEFERVLGSGGGAFLRRDNQPPPDISDLPAAGNYAERLLIYELKKIIRAITISAPDDRAATDSSLDLALMQYKLGVELMAPDDMKDLLRKDELRWQKELCRFLLEREIYAVGTNFGAAETDLFAPMADHAILIEAQLYKDTARPLERTIKGSFVRLQNSLSQTPGRSRGILVIYNFTAACISAPRAWINGLIRIVPINLKQQPPSTRTRHVVIETADADNATINVKASAEA